MIIHLKDLTKPKVKTIPKCDFWGVSYISRSTNTDYATSYVPSETTYVISTSATQQERPRYRSYWSR